MGNGKEIRVTTCFGSELSLETPDNGHPETEDVIRYDEGCSEIAYSSALESVRISPSLIHILNQPNIKLPETFREGWKRGEKKETIIKEALGNLFTQSGLNEVEDMLLKWRLSIAHSVQTTDDVLKTITSFQSGGPEAYLGKEGALPIVSAINGKRDEVQKALMTNIASAFNVSPTDRDLDRLVRYRKALVDSVIREAKTLIGSDPHLLFQTAIYLTSHLNLTLPDDVLIYSSLIELVDEAKRKTSDPTLRAYFEMEFKANTQTLTKQDIEGFGQVFRPNKDNPLDTLFWMRFWLHKYNYAFYYDGFDQRYIEDLEKEFSSTLSDIANDPKWTNADKEVILKILEPLYVISVNSTLEGGPLASILLSSNPSKKADVEAVEKRLAALEGYARRAEQIVSSSSNSGDKDITEMLSDIHWKIYIDGYISGGLPLTAVKNLQGFPQKFQGTNAYKENIRRLHEKYPWLVSEDGKITLEAVGDNGDEAENRTRALFLRSNNFVWDSVLPMAGGVVCSPLGPWASVACAGGTKYLNQERIAADKDVDRLIKESRATGISVVDPSTAQAARREDLLDWAFTIGGTRLAYSFNRGVAGIASSLTKGVASGLASGVKGIFNEGARTVGRNILNSVISRDLWFKLGSNAKGMGLQIRSRVTQDLKDAFTTVPKEVLQRVNWRLSPKRAIFETSLLPLRLAYGLIKRPTIRLLTGTSFLVSDKLDDGEIFNSNKGVIGLAFFTNELTEWALGWRSEGAGAALLGRLGLEYMLIRSQGYSKMPIDVIITNLITAGIIRSTNKLNLYGLYAANDSKLLPHLTRFLAKQKTVVPISVVGMKTTPSRHRVGILRTIEIGKKAETNVELGGVIRAEQLTKKQREFYQDAIRNAVQGSVEMPKEIAEAGITSEMLQERYGLSKNTRSFVSSDRKRIAIVDDSNGIMISLKCKQDGEVRLETIPVRLVERMQEGGRLVRVSYREVLPAAGSAQGTQGTNIRRVEVVELNRTNSFTTKDGKSHLIVVEPLDGRLDPVSRWFSNTYHWSLSDMWIAQGFAKVARWLSRNKARPTFLERLFEATKTKPEASRAVLTFRGSLMSLEYLPYIYLIKGLGQFIAGGADPSETGKYEAANYTWAGLVVHRYIQNPSQLDGFVSNLLGYGFGMLFTYFVLSKFFPTQKSNVPAFDEQAGGNDNYLSRLEGRDYGGASQLIFEKGLTTGGGVLESVFESVFGFEIKKVTILPDKVKTFRDKMLALAEKANEELTHVKIPSNLNATGELKKMKSKEDAIRFFSWVDSVLNAAMNMVEMARAGKTPSEAEAKVFLINAAVLKMLTQDRSLVNIHPYLKEAALILDPYVKNMPDIRFDPGIKRLVNAINEEM